MSDARKQEDEPLTQLDVSIDTRHLDSLEGEASTSPGTDPETTSPGTDPSGADNEPQTMEPPRVMGVPRLRAPTIMGVAPPSSGGNEPPPTTIGPSGLPAPNRSPEDADEQTTLVGKLLAEAHLEVAKRLKDRSEPKDGDLYQDETATTVGDAEKLIAAANAAAFGKANENANDAIEENDEPTESRNVADALMEDVTSKRDAINIDSALARAAELRAEAEARKKRAMKKRTIHGLGDGPLTLPASTAKEKAKDEIPTFDNKVDTRRESEKLLVATPVAPADGEMETLSVGVGQPAPMRSIGTEPETMPVNVPLPTRDRQPAAVPPGATLLSGGNPMGGAPSFPSTQPMPHAPTVRHDENGGAIVDPALRATMQQPPQPPPHMNGQGPYAHSPHGLGGTPPGGVPPYHSTPMPMPAAFSGAHPHAGATAFAQTAVGTGGHPALPAAPPEKKGGKGGLIVFLLFLATVGGVGYWQRARVKDSWDRFRHPPAPTATASEAPSAGASATAPEASASASATTSASASASVSASASASAAPHGSSSAAPHASSSAAPHGSASASAAPSASAKPPAKKPPPWKPPPQRPKPKPAAPKPIDDGRGF